MALEMEYKLTNHNSVIRLSDNSCIPFAEDNRDYQEYLQWLAEGNEPHAADHEPAKDPLTIAKQERHELVDKIVVTTTSGNTFDGNELAQGRMARAILAMSDSDTNIWVLANNTVVAVSKAELQEALRLAGSEMSRHWVKPYTGQTIEE